jgi:predicted MFS family arabinose efflux permease
MKDAPAGKPSSTAVFLCGMFAFINLYCTQPLLPLLSRVFQASEAQVSWTISASTLGVAFSAGMLAIFAERVDRKKTIYSGRHLQLRYLLPVASPVRFVYQAT